MDVASTGVQQSGRAYQHGRMQVMTTGVHRPFRGRPELDVCVFMEGKSIHVGAQQHGGPIVSTIDDSRNTRCGVMFSDLDMQIIDGLHHALTGGGQRESEFGVAVQLAAQLHRVRQ